MKAMKTCSGCKMPKAFGEFSKDGNRKDGLQSWCKECVKVSLKEYRSKNKEQIAMGMKNYRSKNKEEIAAYMKDYFLKNKKQILTGMEDYRFKHKEQISRQQKGYQKERMRTDIQFRLSCQLRSRLREAIKGNFKSGSAVRDLGCTIPELKFYLEGQFQDGMTWDNHSLEGWHIDHKIPLDFFDLTNREQFLQAVHYTNLQPMWAKENIRKSNKVA